MELSECKLCGTEIEHFEYGKPIRTHNAPHELDICNDCLRTLKLLLDKIELE